RRATATAAWRRPCGGNLGPRQLPRVAAGRSLRAPGRSPRRNPPPRLQRAGNRAQRAASRGTRHQRAAVGGLPVNLRPALIAMLVLAASAAAGFMARAQNAPVIYRCTDASGAVTIQNDTPCPAGSKQQIRKVEALPSTPPPPSPSLQVVEKA